MKKIILYTIIFCLILCTILANAQSPEGYLILQDIGSYKLKTQVKNPISKKIRTITGYKVHNNSGSLIGADHFDLDHDDTSYETVYENKDVGLGVDVQVTQHAGGDSDRWLGHEIEDSYREGDEHAKLGMIIQATRIREINGNKIIGRRGNGYTWVSNDVVVDISYTDLQGNKPEPLEVVQAYLQKFSSSITTTPADFKGNVYNIKWIKDEIDRRLWLCDKWNAQFQAGGVTQANLMTKLLENMDVFLKYRQKYFGIAYEDEDRTLDGYQQNNDLASIQNKLREYKTWWNANKGKSITLP